MKTQIKTMMVAYIVSFREGQVTFFNSVLTSLRKANAFFNTCPPYQPLRPRSRHRAVMAGLEGFEPPTSAFGARRSAN